MSIEWPERLIWSGWVEHAPFVFWLVEHARPRCFVELGTHTGYSYLAVCQAVAKLGLGTRCHAIDHWRGDSHSGLYGEDVYDDLKRYHDPRYGRFSTLHRMLFDEGRDLFEEGGIDLLHIDGFHTYEAVRQDFESWQSKLSDDAIVLFHDVTVRKDDFGVFRFWEELRDLFPAFEFTHCNGLGVLAGGSRVPAGLAPLFELERASPTAEFVRGAYRALGERLSQALTIADLKRSTERLGVDCRRLRKEMDLLVSRAAQPVAPPVATVSPPADPARETATFEISTREFLSIDEYVAFSREFPDYFSPTWNREAAEHVRRNGLYCNAHQEHAGAGDVVFHHEAYRETIVYKGFNSRMRAAYHVFEAAAREHEAKNLKIFSTEAASGLAMFLRGRYPRFLGSAYTEDEGQRQALFPIPVEDLQALSFPDASFHVAIANEVFQHLPFLDRALAELARVLKPGGTLVATFPFLAFAQESVVRARMDNGEIRHVTDPQYGANPVDPKGSLVFEIPGWGILDRTRRAGFQDAAIVWVHSRDCGILPSDSGGILVLKAIR